MSAIYKKAMCCRLSQLFRKIVGQIGLCINILLFNYICSILYSVGTNAM